MRTLRNVINFLPYTQRGGLLASQPQRPSNCFCCILFIVDQYYERDTYFGLSFYQCHLIGVTSLQFLYVYQYLAISENLFRQTGPAILERFIFTMLIKWFAFNIGHSERGYVCLLYEPVLYRCSSF